MTDIILRTEGRAGRITLNRPEALNALTREMALALRKALMEWRTDPGIDLVMIDAAEGRAFCAGGDLAMMYRQGEAGDMAGIARFFRDEYRMNAALAETPVPVVGFLHGFVMGGGVGIGCHADHRIVDDSTRMAMPECGIGLIPDVGGSLLLARAPGRIGEYLGLTGARLEAACALHAGFADHHIPRDRWDAIKTALVDGGSPDRIATLVAAAATPPPESELKHWQGDIDRLFAGDLAKITAAIAQDDSPAATAARKAMARNSPLSMEATLLLIRRVRDSQTIRFALDQEYSFTHRAMAMGDFREGIRAAIIDKDRTPRWSVTDTAAAGALALRMLTPPEDGPLDFDGE